MRCFHPLLRHASSGTSLDPFQILKVSKSASQAEIKQAYFSLVKKHHPDRPASSKPKGFEFKVGFQSLTSFSALSCFLSALIAFFPCYFQDIVAAYDILRDPVKRHQFTTYGMGWGDRPSSPHPDTGFNYENVHNPWRRRGDAQSKYRHAYQRPRYPSSNWDYGHSESTDFYSTSWQTPNSAEGREGMYTSNAAFIGVLAAMSALLYSVQFWRLAPPLPSSSGSSDSSSASFPHNFIAGDPKEAPIYKQSGMMRGRDKHHDEASKALGMARENAQKYGNARREGIR